MKSVAIVLLLLTSTTLLKAQFKFENYRIQNDTVKSIVFSIENEWLYNHKACITDWKTNEGECTDQYGKYSITKEGDRYLEVYKNGNVRREIKMNGKVIDGAMLVYNPKTGKLFAKFIYDQGKLFNVFYFNEDGSDITNGGFKDGDGILNFYRFTGSLAKVIEFGSGQPDGVASYYYSSGTILATGVYKYGRPDGYWREYSRAGKEVQITKMAMGVLVKTESK